MPETVCVPEAVEVCPYCDSENIYRGWDTEKRGYVAVCHYCGREMFLCDECLHSEDNPHKICDWRECSWGSCCRRGSIIE